MATQNAGWSAFPWSGASETAWSTWWKQDWWSSRSTWWSANPAESRARDDNWSSSAGAEGGGSHERGSSWWRDGAPWWSKGGDADAIWEGRAGKGGPVSDSTAAVGDGSDVDRRAAGAVAALESAARADGSRAMSEGEPEAEPLDSAAGRMQAADSWVETWTSACAEVTGWLEMRNDPETGLCPYCSLCKAWVWPAETHLRSPKCRRNAARYDFAPGPILRSLVNFDPASSAVEFPRTMDARARESDVDTACVPLARGPQAHPSQPTQTSDSTSGACEQFSRCANQRCHYMVHSNPSFGGYCCIACYKSRGNRKLQHGRKCEKRDAASNALRAPDEPPSEEASFYQAPQECGQIAADTLCATKIAVAGMRDAYESSLAELELAQNAVRDALGDECFGIGELVQERNSKMDNAISKINLYVTTLQGLPPAPPEGREAAALREAQEILERLGAARRLAVEAAMRRLRELRDAALKAQIRLRNAENARRNAPDSVQLGELTVEDVPALEEARLQARAEARLRDREYMKATLELRGHAETYAPELISRIVESIDEKIKTHMEKLKLSEQSNVLDVISFARDVSHYDDEQGSMSRLGKSSRHSLLGTTYDGEKCVLKRFDFGEARGFEGFLREVELHVRLRGPLVAPLRCAFWDARSGHGFLHFDRYECDLDEWSRKTAPRFPHRLGEPAAASEPNDVAEVRDVVHAMVQSVSQLHSRGFVHGDLKPSNWLWDNEDKIPLLCDFETAINCGFDGQSTTRCSTARRELGTMDFIAPELREDLTRQKTFQSDMYALGKSIKAVLDHRGWTNSSVMEPLRSLASRMLVADPAERVPAPEAERECLRLRGASREAIRIVGCMDVKFTQESCGAQFQNGASLQDLIEAILRDPDYPLSAPQLTIDVVRKGRALLSVDNRRLHCFQEAEKLLGRKILIKIREYTWEPIWDRYFNNLDPNSTNTGIRVRSRRTWTSAPHRENRRRNGN